MCVSRAARRRRGAQVSGLVIRVSLGNVLAAEPDHVEVAIADDASPFVEDAVGGCFTQVQGVSVEARAALDRWMRVYVDDVWIVHSRHELLLTRVDVAAVGKLQPQ